MFTPYQWQEAMSNRAEYVESRLTLGAPVVAASFEPGIVMLTYRRQARKLFELYDRLAFGGVGQQSDIESIRLAALDFAHREGFARSENDVTLHRVIHAISAPMKAAFADFSSPPVIAMALFAELGNTMEEDKYGIVEYDGDFVTTGHCACATPHRGEKEGVAAKLHAIKPKGLDIDKAVETLKEIWVSSFQVFEKSDGDKEAPLRLEAAILERDFRKEARFRVLDVEP
ncbi:MAG: hypothetical protein QY327_04945 [Fimbriimonadaceae bacterium]|uniref:20S proteasome, alpha and beta subunit n=1 Tax=Candidatus Nitrosymbiomonas proteolyticus TaxID=2608984 RepID=A0A809RS01_9BACT|nr:MAG: hypothetical protein EDM74_11810 [Armatimonadota bacterium]KXK14060.1 MAG: 20S proteasome, alpha and beta subunit [Armatimonadetes bacterium OLB18]MCK6632204.1 hypothetical protein [Fimbriimonadaceae bacterium]BBO22472.1 20S proteasome, alpha and beta subunit [Candidatus Nitrosymbiomonas proteolyticus]MCZ7580192.1 hypothetical protein [Fimbriimonadaceae bacterium]